MRLKIDCLVLLLGIALFAPVAHVFAAPPAFVHELPLDARTPEVRYAVQAELGNALWGEYEVSGWWAPLSYVGIGVSIGYRNEALALRALSGVFVGVQLPQSGLIAELAATLLPEGRSLSGFAITIALGGMGTEQGTWLLRSSAWLSQRIAIDGIAVELGAGGIVLYDPRFQEVSVAPQLRCALGFALLQ